MMYEVGGRVFALVVIHDDAGLLVSLSDMKSGAEVGRIALDAQDVGLEGFAVQRRQYDRGECMSGNAAPLGLW